MRRYFNKHVINPIQRNGYVGEGKRAMGVLKNRVLDKIQLRRTKESVAKDINLPPLTVTVEKHEISESERDFYESIYKQSRASPSLGTAALVLLVEGRMPYNTASMECLTRQWGAYLRRRDEV